ncbi:hypothetical protein QSI_3572 [Clostridioides difficile P28]|nr:hypothetical protein QSI_3572 [Clostridioides difficile P28]
MISSGQARISVHQVWFTELHSIYNSNRIYQKQDESVS